MTTYYQAHKRQHPRSCHILERRHENAKKPLVFSVGAFRCPPAYHSRGDAENTSNSEQTVLRRNSRPLSHSPRAAQAIDRKCTRRKAEVALETGSLRSRSVHILNVVVRRHVK